MRSALNEAMTARQLERLERILAATRELLAETGADHLTMRDIAAASGVAEGTLYNRFGTKDSLLSIVVVDFFESAVQTHIEQQVNRTPVQKIAYSAEVVIGSVLQARSFARMLMNTYFKVDGDRQMPERLAQTVQRTWMPILLEMRAQRGLHIWVSLPLLAEELTDRQFGVVAKWAQGQFGDEQLHDRLVYGLLSPLLGASAVRQAGEIATVLAGLTRRLDRTSARPARPTAAKPTAPKKGPQKARAAS